MSEPSILLDIRDGIATTTLNEPDRRNALSQSISESPLETLDAADDSDSSIGHRYP